ncbi:MAG: DUF748 domain-containing protein [Rhodocyclaceae bacterium]|nr:DUF748 domain-containing protein [Rhodocyclaceae bacterium]
MSAPAPSRWKKPVLVVGGLLLAWLVFAALALPSIIRSQAERFVAEKTGHRLAIAELAFNPLTLTLRIGGLRLAQPDDQELLGFRELVVDLNAAGLFRRTVALESVRLAEPRATVVLLPEGRLNWSAFLDALKPKEEKPDEPLPRFDIDLLSVTGGHVAFADRTVSPAFETRIEPLDLELADLSSLPDDRGRHRLAATTAFGARVEWQGQASLNPIAASGELAVTQVALARLAPYFQRHLRIAAPEGIARLSLAYQAAYARGVTRLTIERLAAGIDGLALKGEQATAPAVALDRIEMKDGRFDLAGRTLAIGEITLGGGRLDLRRRADGRLDLQDWLKPSTPAQPEKPAAAAGGAPWKLELARFALDGLALHLADESFAAPLAVDLDKLAVSFAARAEVGEGAPAAAAEKLALTADGLRLAGGKLPLFALGRLAVEGAGIDLAARRVVAERIALERGRVAAARDRQGNIALLEALRPAAAASARGAGAKPPAAAASPWHFKVARFDADGFEAAFRDETVSPAAELALKDIGFHAEGISDDLKAAVPVKAALSVAGGGRLEAEGRAVPADAAADLAVRLADLSLKPMQPYLGAATALEIAGGRLSAQGRASYGPRGYAYKGGLALKELQVVDAASRETFVAWNSLATGTLSVSPAAIDIAELALDGLDTKLLIAKDKSVNVQRALRRPAPPTPPPAAEAPPAAGAAAPAPTPPTADANANPTDPGGPVLNIDRLRISNGEMDFADESLAFPFATRIHGLQGAIVGISSRPGAPGQVELDGQVDDYGLARVVGQLDFFRPTEFMDLKVVFRNVEMTRMTPYTATFAGRKIASGKLSLDLEYRIKKRQLQGENQVVMDQLTLGERVEVPGARDLPLDLAIAVLQDSDGRIDLGLPVSGSLDDPQFSYGQIVWKAIVNVVTKIVTAPFRALGALFGGSEKFENIAFEAGEPKLTPPEREKLVRLAGALNKRPGLAITVHGVHAETDRVALQDRQLRRTIAAKIGQPVEGDADPGPISTRQPKVQAALEDVFADRFGGGELAALKEGFRKANPGQLEESTTGKMVSRLTGLFREKRTLEEAEVSSMKGADFHGLLYDRLRQKEAVGEDRLLALARARGEATVAAMKAAGAPADRLGVAPPEKVETEGRDVPVKLVIGTAKKPAAPPAGAPAPAPAGG